MSKNRDIATFLSSTARTYSIDSAGITSLGGSSTSSVLSVYDTLDSLPMTGLKEGDEAIVQSVSKLYVSNGSGWYNTDIVNLAPYWDTEPDASYNIVDSATPLIVIAKAGDSDTANLINQSTVTDSAQYMVDITNDSSVWTFTPKSADSIGIEVAAGNLTDSNGDFVYTFKWNDGFNFIAKEVTIAYNPAGGFNWGGDRAFFFGGTVVNSPLSWNGSSWNSGSYTHNQSVVRALSLVTGATASASSMSYGTYSGMTAVSSGEKILYEGGYNSNSSYPYSNNWNTIQSHNPVTGSNAGTHGQISGYGSTASGNIGSYNKGGGSDGTNAFFLGGYYDGQNAGGSGNCNGMHLVSFATSGNTTSFGSLQNTSAYYNGAYHNNEHIWYAGTKINMKTQVGASASFSYPSGQYQDTVSNMEIALAAPQTGYIGGGNTYQTVNQYNMAAGGTASFFGNLVAGGGMGSGANGGNAERAAFTGGRRYSQNPPVVYNDGSSTVEYFTFATQGNASSLGSTGANRYSMSGSSGNEA